MADRRHGLPIRSTEWRDPANRAELPPELWSRLDEIADALDAIERRSGRAELTTNQIETLRTGHLPRLVPRWVVFEIKAHREATLASLQDACIAIGNRHAAGGV